jgi:hypothetical protein
MSDETTITREDIKELRHSIRDLSKSVTALDTFRKADSFKTQADIARVVLRLDQIEKKQNEHEGNFRQAKGIWTGVAFIVTALMTGIGWLISKEW